MENNSDWYPIKGEYGNASNKAHLRDLLDKSNIDGGIAAEVMDQIELAEQTEKNIIFIFTENDEYVVTAIHAPEESIDGRSGPILLRGSHDKSIIAVFSREYIAARIQLIDTHPAGAGLDVNREDVWVRELEKLAELVKLEMAVNPPENWDDLLGGS